MSSDISNAECFVTLKQERCRQRLSLIHIYLPGCENSAAINDDNIDNYIESLPVYTRGN